MTDNTPQNPNPRQRTYTWDDPLELARAYGQSSGLEFLQKIAAGELPPPPIARTLDYTLVEVGEGKAIFAGVPAEFHYNPMGMVHGGYAATLLDSVLTLVIQSVLPTGLGASTIELHTYYVRPITRDTGRLRAIGEIIHVGRRIGTAQARLVDDNDKLYSHATTTCMILDMSGGGS